MSETENLTIEVLRQIRDEMAGMRTEVRTELAETRAELRAELAATRNSLGSRIGETNERLSVVETTVLELAEQQRFVVRHLSTLASRDRRLEAEVDDLRARVEVLEERGGR